MPRKPREDLELDPSAYDDPDRTGPQPVTGAYQDVDRQDEE